MSCRTPNVVILPTKKAILAPCGKCCECLQRKKQTWIHRVECEKRYGKFKHCHYITLTYNDEHLPYESYRYVRFGVPQNAVSTGESLLNPYDLRLFFERLRYYVPDGFSYFAVGEYGDKSNTRRPHFHIILFCNQSWDLFRLSALSSWSKLRAETRAERYSRMKDSLKLGKVIKRDKNSWFNRNPYGALQVKCVTYKRICYVSKYVSKQFGLDEIVPPFYTCSKGLGKGFLDSQECKMLSLSNTHYAYMSNGKPTALSRYYSDKMFTPQQKAVFNLMQVTRELPPENIMANTELLKDWYIQQMRQEQVRRRARLLRFHNVPFV